MQRPDGPGASRSGDVQQASDEAPARSPAGGSKKPARSKGEPIEPQRVAVSRGGMAATAQLGATAAASEVLADGGNAMDAAVAAAFALGVCEPVASGLGGQTMMTVYEAETRKTVALDGSSRAPSRAAPGTVKERMRLRGHAASTVPSTPAVLDYALGRWGTMPLSRVLEPAIRLAEEGTEVTALLRRLTKRTLKMLRARSAGPIFLRDGEKPYSVGSLLRQPVLAGTLRQLAEKGVEDFYVGEIAAAIERDMKAHDGLIRRDDLANVPMPIERRPLACRFEGLRVFTFPPPGAGRTLVEMLNILSHFPPGQRLPDTPRGAAVLAEVIRRAFLDRNDRPFDPNFYPQVQERHMLSGEYAKLVAKQVRKRSRPRGETTHLSVMDRHGNAVALTQSIERVYGSCEASPELGFLYNDYMSAFEYEDISHPYFMRPNGVPWASVAPTIVLRGRYPWLAIGSPGSERITPAIVQVLLRLLSQPPLDAVVAPRLHCSIDGKVSLEATRMRDDIPTYLERRGYAIDVREAESFYLGCVQLVLREGRELIGVADPRRDGAAMGPKR